MPGIPRRRLYDIKRRMTRESAVANDCREGLLRFRSLWKSCRDAVLGVLFPWLYQNSLQEGDGVSQRCTRKIDARACQSEINLVKFAFPALNLLVTRASFA